LLFDERDEHVVGFITIVYGRKDAYLANIGITKQHQSNGYGQKVFDWWIAEGVLRNKQTVSLHTSVQNHVMLALAERNGFKPVKTIKDYYTSGYLDGDGVLLQKLL
jgi:ribosomal-protein-alanine N-acetyltransferase